MSKELALEERELGKVQQVQRIAFRHGNSPLFEVLTIDADEAGILPFAASGAMAFIDDDDAKGIIRIKLAKPLPFDFVLYTGNDLIHRSVSLSLSDLVTNGGRRSRLFAQAGAPSTP